MATATTSSTEIIGLFDQYVIGNYPRFPVCLVRGEESYVWDAEGRRYLDFFPGWGCDLIGHCPRVVEAVREQIGQLIHVPNTWYTEAQGLLAKALSERSGFDAKCFFCNSGTEAVEAAIKLARLHGKPTGRYKIVSTIDSFHGRTLWALSATGQPKYHQGLDPLLPGFKYAPFGDLEATAKLIDNETCAILVETIQGEGGVNLPPPGYLKGLRDLADTNNLLLVLDEVQAGMGRTGRWFGYQHWDVLPDAATLAKALAGGVACGALMCRPQYADLLKPGTHAATFGGNPIACRAALATIETIEEDGLLRAHEQIGERFRNHFEALKKRSPLIQQIRIKGTMIGVELSVPGSAIVDACLKRQLLINCTHTTVLHLLPALTLTDELIDEGCGVLEEVLLAHKS